MKARIQDGVVYSPYKSFRLPKCSLFTFLEDHLRKYGEKTAVIENEVRLNFDEVLRRLLCYTSGFKRTGLKPGERVCLQVDNTLESILAAWGVILAGGTLLLIPENSSSPEIVQQMTDSNATKMLVDTSYIERVKEVEGKYKIEAVYVVGDHPDYVSIGSFQILPDAEFVDATLRTTKVDTVATLSYTSGSTGPPKLVQIPHSYFMADIASAMVLPFANCEDIGIIVHKVFGVFGLHIPLIYWCSGATVVLVKDERNFANAVDLHQVTTIIGLASHVRRITNVLVKENRKLPSVAKITVTGSALPASCVKSFQAVYQLKEFRNLYGSTEAGNVACTPCDEISLSSIGFPAPNVQIKVVDPESGKILGPGVNGELLSKGPCYMRGYYNQPATTAAKIDDDDWIRTGDIGNYDTNGNIFLVGRIKEIIKVHDHSVPPLEIEEILHSHEQVEDASVVGTPHEDYGEVATAFVIRKCSDGTSAQVTETELQQLVAAHAGPQRHLYGGVVFVDSFPRSATGKVLKRILVEEHLMKTTAGS